jgi:hypothetical protein
VGVTVEPVAEWAGTLSTQALKNNGWMLQKQ